MATPTLSFISLNFHALPSPQCHGVRQSVSQLLKSKNTKYLFLNKKNHFVFQKTAFFIPVENQSPSVGESREVKALLV